MLDVRDRTLDRHPRIRFILCHPGNQGNDLASAEKLLDKYPSVYMDISARAYEVGRQWAANPGQVRRQVPDEV
jgi:predicted TIM-barrel fold metal-dependent hydrolase